MNTSPKGPPKYFGIGLSRTGTKSLSFALMTLGIRVAHYPDDATTLKELYRGDYDFSLLNYVDGITDITVVPYYPQLDRLFPGSKFIHTIRDKQSWLKSMRTHLANGQVFREPPYEDLAQEIHVKTSRFVKAAVYGCYGFSEERLSYVYDRHYEQVKQYFKHRPYDYLELDICGGEGWHRLCSFLEQPLPNQVFPHILTEDLVRITTTVA